MDVTGNVRAPSLKGEFWLAFFAVGHTTVGVLSRTLSGFYIAGQRILHDAWWGADDDITESTHEGDWPMSLIRVVSPGEVTLKARARAIKHNEDAAIDHRVLMEVMKFHRTFDQMPPGFRMDREGYYRWKGSGSMADAFRVQTLALLERERLEFEDDPPKPPVGSPSQAEPQKPGLKVFALYGGWRGPEGRGYQGCSAFVLPAKVVDPEISGPPMFYFQVRKKMPALVRVMIQGQAKSWAGHQKRLVDQLHELRNREEKQRLVDLCGFFGVDSALAEKARR